MNMQARKKEVKQQRQQTTVSIGVMNDNIKQGTENQLNTAKILFITVDICARNEHAHEQMAIFTYVHLGIKKLKTANMQEEHCIHQVD